MTATNPMSGSRQLQSRSRQLQSRSRQLQKLLSEEDRRAYINWISIPVNADQYREFMSEDQAKRIVMMSMLTGLFTHGARKLYYGLKEEGKMT